MVNTHAAPPTRFSSGLPPGLPMGQDLAPKSGEQVKFFLWLFLQHKLLTADRIIKRGGQANPICQLCRTRNENASHLAANCSYSKSVWTHISQVAGQQYLLAPITDLKTWWSSMISDSMERSPIITYTIWSIWKEWCQRFYDNKAITAIHLASLVQQDVAVLRLARTFFLKQQEEFKTPTEYIY